MNGLRIMGKIFWNKGVKTVLIAAAVLLASFKIWDCWDFACSRGEAEAQEMAREEKLWKIFTDVYGLHKEYYQTKHKLIKDRAVRQEKNRFAYSVRAYMFDKTGYEEMRKCADKSLKKHLQCRERLLQITDNGEFGYCDEIMMCLALYYREFAFNLMCDEILANTGNYFNCIINNKDIVREYCNLYSSENKDNEFKYPDYDYLSSEKTIESIALLNPSLLCIKKHCGYRLWQGCPSSSVYDDVCALWGSCDYYVDVFMLAPSRMDCLERRLLRGSKFAAFWLPISRSLSAPLLFDKYIRFMMGLENNRRRGAIMKYAEAGAPLPNYLAERTPEDRLWYVVRYMSAAADNYLWTVKFIADHKLKHSRLQQVRLLPRYGKNSPELQVASRNLAADIQFCRRKLQSAEFKNLPEGMKKASSELCTASEAVLRTWERYRQGKMNYAEFYRTLKHDETVFEKKRQDVLGRRWDYMYDRTKGNGGYIVVSLSSDGVSVPELQRLVQSKLYE